MNRVLLTVSGSIPDDLDAQIAEGRRPRADYLVMAGAFGADLVDYDRARASCGWIGRLSERIGGPDLLLAWYCFRVRRRYDVIFTDGEQVGLPLAGLFWLTRRRPTHLMIVHIMSVAKKVRLFRTLRLGRNIDRIFVYASAQRRFMVDQLGYPADQVTLTPFMTDTEFFHPPAHPVDDQSRPVVSSAGLEFRDYATMIEAIRELDADVVIAAASPWSKRRDTTTEITIPDHVEIRRLGLDELRELYARSTVVVVPVVETDFQAGITTILEAMAMGKPVIATRTTGQVDTIVDGVNGRYVEPGDAASLRSTLDELLGDPEQRERLGEAARQWVVEHADVEAYAARLADHVRSHSPSASH